jgi:serine/threonine protein kinase/tetratricopeptide (TPR) repeat protein
MSQDPPAPAVPEPPPLPAAAKAVKSRWWRGTPPDTLAVLAEHPDLAEDRAAVLDLAYEEYWLRRQAGEDLDPEAYAARYPGMQASMLRMLVIDEAVGDGPALFDAVETAGWPWPGPGALVGPFTLRRELGRGTFARAYLATDAATGDRPVVLKLSRRDGEARTLGRLDHDHIVPVLSAGYDPQTEFQFVCMPFLGSATLADVLEAVCHRRGALAAARGSVVPDAVRGTVRPGDPLPVCEQQPLPAAGRADPHLVTKVPDLSRLSYAAAVACLGGQLASALAFLHQRGLAHGDLKPSNVLVTAQGRALLLDFNLATTGGVVQASIGGTVVYMAPELIRAWRAGQVLTIEQAGRADLYALGVVLYELLTGRHPLGTPPPSDDAALARWVLERQRAGGPPVRADNPAVPARLARLVGHCLAFDPADRPASAAELARALHECGGRPAWRARAAVLSPGVWRWGLGALAGACLGVTAWAALDGSSLLFFRPSAFIHPPSKVSAGPASVDPGPAAGEAALARGLRLHRAGNLRGAQEAFGAADEHFRKAGGRRWDDLVRRGQTRMLLGDLEQAHALFDEAETCWQQAARAGPAPAAEVRRGEVLACQAYCLAGRRKHAVARQVGRKALQAGFRTPATLNNLAYSCLQRGSPGELAEARRYLTEALRRDPQFLPALRNKVWLALRQYLRGRPRGAVPAWLAPEMDRVLRLSVGQLGRETARLYEDAARVYACSVLAGPGGPTGAPRSALEQQACIDRVRQYLTNACLQGADPRRLREDPFLSQVAGLAFIDSLTCRPRPDSESLTVSLANPLLSFIK